MRAAFLCLALMMAAAPAAAGNYHRAAGDNDAAPASNTLTITSPQKCYDQIGQAEAQDVRLHFERPYEECLRRLSEKLKREQQEKAAKEKAAVDAAVPPAPSNYYRVQKPKKPAEAPADKAAEKSAEKPAEKPLAK